MSRRIAGARVLAVAAIGLPAAFGAAPAVASETVQLAPVMVAARAHGGAEMVRQPLSIRLETSDKQSADYVCALYPRLRDALVRDLGTRRFVVAADGTFPVDGLGERLRPAMTRALGRDLIGGIDLVHGTHPLPSVMAARLMRGGCLRIGR
jgi:hypothetical protein